MGWSQIASKRIQGSNWLKITILFITVPCCFQANKIKVSLLLIVSSQIIILIKQLG